MREEIASYLKFLIRQSSSFDMSSNIHERFNVNIDITRCVEVVATLYVEKFRRTRSLIISQIHNQHQLNQQINLFLQIAMNDAMISTLALHQLVERIETNVDEKIEICRCELVA